MLWTHLTSFSVLQILIRQDSQEKKIWMKMNINFQVTGNDRKKSCYINNTWYYISSIPKHKISLIMISWFYLQSSLKEWKKNNNKNQWYSYFEKNFWSVTWRNTNSLFFWKRNTISLQFHHSRLKIYHYLYT